MSHVLIVDDDVGAAAGLAELVAREGFTTAIAHNLKEAFAQMALQRPDAVLLDIQLPDGSGMELFENIEDRNTTEIVLITGYASLETSVEALRLGAADYLTKPVNFRQVKKILARIARPPDLKAEIGRLRGELRSLGRFGPLVGQSAAMQSVYDQIARVAPTAATVLITGESGTGKELVAQTVHELSRRRKQLFLPVNCSAISPELLESEVFGHEKGSFTGATREHKGYFQRADGGTLFLDEITEMPIELQAKLLRVLETGSFLRVGAEQPIETDVRVIAATNRDPEEAVAQGKLRDDLLYRLQVFPLHLPPLREREKDIELLVNHSLAELNQADGTAKTLSREALTQFRGHSWPGNVRELKNVLQRAFIMAGELIDSDCLPPDFGSGKAPPGFSSKDLPVGLSIAEAERRLILATLAHCGGNKENTAQMLGISLKTLYNRLRDYGSD